MKLRDMEKIATRVNEIKKMDAEVIAIDKLFLLAKDENVADVSLMISYTDKTIDPTEKNENENENISLSAMFGMISFGSREANNQSDTLELNIDNMGLMFVLDTLSKYYNALRLRILEGLEKTE